MEEEIAALVTAAVAANRRLKAEESSGSKLAEVMLLLKEARQVELLTRFPERVSLVHDANLPQGYPSVGLASPVSYRELDGTWNKTLNAHHAKRERLKNWVSEDTILGWEGRR